MSFDQWKYALGLGFALTNPLYAETIQVPQCLATHLSSYQLIAENKEFKIIDLPLNELEKLSLLADKIHCGRFKNLSHQLVGQSHEAKQKTAKALLKKELAHPTSRAYQIKHKEAVENAISKVNSTNIWQNLAHLTQYYNRSSLEKTGLEAAEWLKDQFESLARNSGREDTSAYFVEIGKPYLQPSLVTVIGKSLKKPAIVIGAHMDTLSGEMPGAGDNASGCSVLLEMTKLLLSEDIVFNRPIYIIWYAAEELGLVGSEVVVRDFLAQNIPVEAVIQFDMAGYRHQEKNPKMWIFNDEKYSDKELNQFIAELIKTYIKVPIGYSKCGFACSDHASWMDAGIPAAFPVETSFAEHNPYIHTSEDKPGLLNTEHLMNFTKLALAFAIELASED